MVINYCNSIDQWGWHWIVGLLLGADESADLPILLSGSADLCSIWVVGFTPWCGLWSAVVFHGCESWNVRLKRWEVQFLSSVLACRLRVIG